MKKFFKEFLQFANRGNVLDLAVAVILGGAITSVVQSLVSQIFTPLLSLVIGRIDIGTLSLKVNSILVKGKPITFGFGNFLNSIITFLADAFCIFLIIKFLTWLRSFNPLKKREESDPDEPPAPPTTDELLTEIRDLLRAQQPFDVPGQSSSASELPDDLEGKH